MRHESRSRRRMNGKSDPEQMAFVLVSGLILLTLVIMVLLAFFVWADETVSQEQSRWGEPIGEMVIGLVDVTTGPLAF